jgi:glycosyltransferase involved in cell wall biosynthesis
MSEPLSVGLNLTYLLENSGGSGTYARGLIRGIQAVEPDTRITAFVSDAAPESVVDPEWGRSVDWVRFPFDIGGAHPWTPALTMGYQWIALPFLARRHRLDVIHGLANIVPLLAPGVATVVTLLDVIWIHFPRAMERRATLAMKAVAPACARRADRVIAISETGREDIVRTLRLDPNRVDVTHLGVSVDDRADPMPEGPVRQRLGLGSGPVILCVAQKRQHKNLTALVRALARLDFADACLVIPGSHTPYEEELADLARTLDVEARVHLPGWVSDEELEGLYQAASCFVLPSFIEGFGLPILEAMRRGVPVACSNVSSLPEVAGDAALLIDPHDPDDIARAISRLIGDRALRAQLIQRGHERCAHFNWQATARATLASYRRAIASA